MGIRATYRNGKLELDNLGCEETGWIIEVTDGGLSKLYDACSGGEPNHIDTFPNVLSALEEAQKLT